MQLLKLIRLKLLQLAEQGRSFFQGGGGSSDEKRLQVAQDELEVERLDRIRNPSKYRLR